MSDPAFLFSFFLEISSRGDSSVASALFSFALIIVNYLDTFSKFRIRIALSFIVHLGKTLFNEAKTLSWYCSTEVVKPNRMGEALIVPVVRKNSHDC